MADEFVEQSNEFHPMLVGKPALACLIVESRMRTPANAKPGAHVVNRAADEPETILLEHVEGCGIRGANHGPASLAPFIEAGCLSTSTRDHAGLRESRRRRAHCSAS